MRTITKYLTRINVKYDKIADKNCLHGDPSHQR